MIKIGSVTFPQNVANDVAECYNSLPAPKEEVRIVDTYIYNDGNQDIKAFSIFEYEESSEEDLVRYLEERRDAFSKIPGVTYEAADWIRVKDAQKMLADGSFDQTIFNVGMGL